MFTLIQAELKEIFAHLEKDYHLKAGHLTRFIPDFHEPGTDTLLRPSLLIQAAKVSDGYNQKCKIMAGVIQLVYLAQRIHNHIPDECPKNLPQFPVLIGDYLFSKFFKKLSDFNLLEWLAPLATVICKMNEGGIIRRETIEAGKGHRDNYLDVLLLEDGLLTGLACKIGATLGGCNPGQIKALETYGINLGMAWGNAKRKYPLSSESLFAEARAAILDLFAAKKIKDLLSLTEGIKMANSNCWDSQKIILPHAL